MPVQGPHDIDYERALDVIAAILLAPDLDTFARVATTAILELIPGLSASYNELNPLTNRAFAVITPEPEPGWFERYQPPFETHMLQNPLLAHYFRTGDTRALTWDDVASTGRALGTELDRTFYEPNGIRSQLAVQLPAPKGIIIGIAINRGAEGFGAAERQVLNRLRPHLVHAYRAVELRKHAAVMQSVLGADGWAVVLLDNDGRVVDSSPGTAEAAAHYNLDLIDGASLGSGPLHKVVDVIKNYDAKSPAVASEPIPVLGNSGILEAVVIPSPFGPHVVLLRARRGSGAILSQYGMTPRQRDVAMALAEGLTNQQIADTLGIALGTVKKHLEGVFECLQVKNRAAAIAKVHELCRG